MTTHSKMTPRQLTCFCWMTLVLLTVFAGQEYNRSSFSFTVSLCVLVAQLIACIGVTHAAVIHVKSGVPPAAGVENSVSSPVPETVVKRCRRIVRKPKAHE